MFESVLQDVRFAVRSLAKAPGFTAAVVFTMALGIGANAVVFAVVKTVVINALPYDSPDRLVTIAEAGGDGPNASTVSAATVRDWRVRSQSFSRLSLWRDFGVTAIESGRADMLRGERVTADFFDTLGIRMHLGRRFRPDEDTPGGSSVLVLAYRTWQERFGSDPAVIGRVVPVSGGAFTIVGVLPADFQPLHMTNPAELPQIFAPLGSNELLDGCRSCRDLRAIGRLRPGVTSGEAQAELGTITRALAREHPDDYPRDAFAVVTPLRDQLVGHFGEALWALQGAVALLLLLACANVATLLLARAAGRRAEVSVRAALGAGRWRLVRQMLTESLLLAAAGGGVGVLASWWLVGVVARSAGTIIPRIGELAPDGSVLLFGLAASGATGLAFGIAPAAAAWRDSLVAGLRTGQASTASPSHHAAVRVLVTGEISLAFVLVLSVGLLGKSYVRVLHVDPGYEPANVLTLSLLPDGQRYPSFERHLAYFDAVSARMQAIPGVESAGYASTLPLSNVYTSRMQIRERPQSSRAEDAALDTYLVSSSYFHVVRIPVIRGRGFTAQDVKSAPPVAVVSASTARTQFGAADPIGAHIRIERFGEEQPWAVIVGVVGDVHQYGLDQKPDAAVYLPFAQTLDAQGYARLVVRSALGPERIEPAVRAAMAAVDPLLPVFHLQPMTTYVSLSVARRTFTLALITVFGGLALLLATVGIFGVASFVVALRTREVGVRLALGATPGAVRWLVLRQMAAVATVGLAGGCALAAVCTRALSPWLFGVERLDISTACAVAALLGAAAMAASYMPLAQIDRFDPQVTLRGE
jgi:predicted permease